MSDPQAATLPPPPRDSAPEATPSGPVVEIPKPVQAYIGRTIPTFDAATFNTLRLVDPQPIVQPRVKIWRQYDKPWGYAMWLRPEKMRNNPKKLTGVDNWTNHACHPTCLAMVLHWWSELNPATKRKLVFPYPGADGVPSIHTEPSPFTRVQKPDPEPAGITPPEMCRRLFNTETVPTRRSGGEYVVDHDTLREGMKGVLFNRGDKQVPMTAAVFQPSSDLSTTAKALKFFLTLGPVVTCLYRPGHYVLVDGYRRNKIYICDPGGNIDNAKNWTKLSHISNKNRERQVVASDDVKDMEYLGEELTQEDFDKKYGNSKNVEFRKKNPSDEKGLLVYIHQQWLRNISQIEVYYFDEHDEHNEWSLDSATP
jgi:hypothetical protein